MRCSVFFLLLLFISAFAIGQDYYDKARMSFNEGKLDSARFYINKNLSKKPDKEDYFLSALIHEAQEAPLRALADYEAVIRDDFSNLEAYFQKGMIYFNSGSYSQALQDFTHVIDHIDESQTHAIYFGNDPLGVKGTFVTTLQSMKGRVYQYRGMAYERTLEWEAALEDFASALTYDSTAEVYINRSQVYSKMNQDARAIADLRSALVLEPDNYLAWYNLALLDESALLPTTLIEDETFSPLLNLMGGNAYETGDNARSVQFYTKSLQSNPSDDLALIGRGKSRLRLKAYPQGRADFVKALQINPKRTEAFYLIGNSFFYEQSFQEAIGFYEQYLSIDPLYENVWYNAAMSYLSTTEKSKACTYLKKAADLGMTQATEMLAEHCDSQ